MDDVLFVKTTSGVDELWEFSEIRHATSAHTDALGFKTLPVYWEPLQPQGVLCQDQFLTYRSLSWSSDLTLHLCMRNPWKDWKREMISTSLH